MDRARIEQFNAAGFANDPNMIDLPGCPDTLEGLEVTRRIESLSKPFHSPLYFHQDGRPVEAADYARYADNLNLQALPERVSIQFGMAVQRTDMRTWPSRDTAYRSADSVDLDRFQENGLFPGDGVLVLHRSRDHEWCFVQSYNYQAWVRREHIALTDRNTVTDYQQTERFIVVTGAQVRTNFNPRNPKVSELQFDMGVKLPLAGADESLRDIDGQSTLSGFAVRLPVASASGTLEFHTGLIARSQDVREAFLDYTQENVIRQAFKFLGERYGWGHSCNARDCSGLVTDVFRSFGILMPRNTAQQIRSPLGETTHFSAKDGREFRARAVAALEVGDLVYSPGHVMIFIGNDQGQPYVLHDTSSPISFENEDGTVYRGTLNGVSVTPFLTLRDADGHNYFDEMLAIKKIR